MFCADLNSNPSIRVGEEPVFLSAAAADIRFSRRGKKNLKLLATGLQSNYRKINPPPAPPSIMIGSIIDSAQLSVKFTMGRQVRERYYT